MSDADLPLALAASAQRLLQARRSSAAHHDADLRRSLSACYYALFHELCETCATALVGEREGGLGRAWEQVYRSVDHSTAKNACLDAMREGGDFPEGVRIFAKAFVEAQNLRHRADYDPKFEANPADVYAVLNSVRYAMIAFIAVEKKHKCAFAVLVCLRRRVGRAAPT